MSILHALQTLTGFLSVYSKGACAQHSLCCPAWELCSNWIISLWPGSTLDFTTRPERDPEGPEYKVMVPQGCGTQLRSAKMISVVSIQSGEGPPLSEHWEGWDPQIQGLVHEQHVSPTTGSIWKWCDLSLCCNLCVRVPHGTEHLTKEMQTWCQWLERAPPRPRSGPGEGVTFLSPTTTKHGYQCEAIQKSCLAKSLSSSHYS